MKDRSFDELVLRFAEPALRFAFVQVRDRSVAEELVQQAFFNVWKAGRTPEQDHDFKRLLYRTIANLAVSYHRHLKVVGAVRVEPSENQDPFDAFLMHDLIMTALASLPLRERALLYLRYFEDESLNECARQLELNPVTARVLVGRALEKLRKRLKESFPAGVAQDAI